MTLIKIFSWFESRLGIGRGARGAKAELADISARLTDLRLGIEKGKAARASAITYLVREIEQLEEVEKTIPPFVV